MNSVSGIYIISNVYNQKIYIGQAQNIRARWHKHRTALRHNCHDNKHLQAAWNKYGEKAFEFKILERCNVSELDVREQHYLDVYMPKGNCYNLCPIASSMRGIKRSPETRQRMSESQKGRKITDAHREKLVQSHIGHRHSEETRQRMSEAQKRRPPYSEETLKKKSDAARNISEETRQKYRDAAKRREARKRAERDKSK